MFPEDFPVFTPARLAPVRLRRQGQATRTPSPGVGARSREGNRRRLAHALLRTSIVGRRVGTCAIAVLLAAAASAWVLATEHRDAALDGEYGPRETRAWPVSPGGGQDVREDALRRARVRLAPPSPTIDLDTIEPPLTCRFIARYPTGTSPKFDCVLDGGDIVKVKYGRNPEIAAEVAATRLLSALGYAADRMSLVPKVRCHGCPRHPFVAMRLLQITGTYSLYPQHGDADGYSDFSWSAIERKFDAVPIELPEVEGWAWWELENVDTAAGATRIELDELRLVAVFLGHWDNKSENQRLVCLDTPAGNDARCQRPLLMLQDLGATFGPSKANLARWATLPIWTDRETCSVSMKALPFAGGTFPDARITEAARARVAQHLGAFTDADISGLFAAARFPEHYAGTDDDRDLARWVEAFRHRVEQISAAGPCPQ